MFDVQQPESPPDSRDQAGLRRDISTRFQKGVSGNPGGKAKLDVNVKELARSKTKRAFERIVELVESDDERVAFMAAKEVIDRAYGKSAPADDEDARNAKSVTINIVRLTEGAAPPAINGHAVQVRRLSDDADSNAA